MSAVRLQVIPSFYTKISKNSLFVSANTYENYIVSIQYCFARHDDKMCFPPNCRYHIIIISNIKELLQKLDAFCFIYQHVVCMYLLFRYDSVAKLLLRMADCRIMCKGQSISTTETEEWKECPASLKRHS